MIGTLAYMADAAILGTYYLTARDPKKVRWFNWANAFGAIPLVILNLGAGLIQPAILTGMFGFIGAIGCIRQIKRATINT